MGAVTPLLFEGRTPSNNSRMMHDPDTTYDCVWGYGVCRRPEWDEKSRTLNNILTF